MAASLPLLLFFFPPTDRKLIHAGMKIGAPPLSLFGSLFQPHQKGEGGDLCLWDFKAKWSLMKRGGEGEDEVSSKGDRMGGKGKKSC